jgi:hypothetical protein
MVKVIGVLAEHPYQKVEGLGGHHQVGSFFERGNLLGGGFQTGWLNHDTDDGGGPQVQKVQGYHTDDLEDPPRRSRTTRLRTVSSETPIWSATVVNG